MKIFIDGSLYDDKAEDFPIRLGVVLDGQPGFECAIITHDKDRQVILNLFHEKPDVLEGWTGE